MIRGDRRALPGSSITSAHLILRNTCQGAASARAEVCKQERVHHLSALIKPRGSALSWPRHRAPFQAAFQPGAMGAARRSRNPGSGRLIKPRNPEPMGFMLPLLLLLPNLPCTSPCARGCTKDAELIQKRRNFQLH